MTDKSKLTVNQMLERRLRLAREPYERHGRDDTDEVTEPGSQPDNATSVARDAVAPSAEPDEETKIRAWEEHRQRYADENGGLVPPKPSPKPYSTKRHVRLPMPPVELVAPAREAPPPDTETLLNALIAECRFLMHEVAFHSMRLTPDADDRLRFMSAAESMAITGAKVGESVAKLRGGTTVVEERRQHMLVEHVQRVVATQPAPEGEGARG